MEDGDRFIVPPKPSSVNIVGAVYEQSSFLFDPQRRVFGYLKQAGGANRDADKEHAFVIRADGSVFSRDSAKTFWGNEFDQSRVQPGDTIVVPEKTYRGNGIRNLLEFLAALLFYRPGRRGAGGDHELSRTIESAN